METSRELNEGRADTDYKKEDVMRVLLAVWKANPSLRLGQLLTNATHDYLSGRDLFYIEDTKLRDEVIRYGGS